MEEPIPSFIPISHHSNETARLEMKEYYLTNTNSVSFIQPVPLATREPPPLLPNMEQLQLVVQQATEGFKEEMTRTVRSLTEQVSYLTKNQNSKAYHEFGPHTSGIWCTILGCPNPMGHIVVNSVLCYSNNNTRWLHQINTRNNNRPKSLNCINHHTDQSNQGQMMNHGHEDKIQFMLCVEDAIQ